MVEGMKAKTIQATTAFFFTGILFGLLIGNVVGCSENDADRPMTSSAIPTYAKAPSDRTRITFIELGSDRCIPCRAMREVMRRLEQKYPEELKIVFYDVWTEDGRPAADQYGIRVIPTQVFLDEDGKEFFRHEGYPGFDEAQTIMQERLAR